MAEELLAERADGNEAVGAGAVERGEQAETRDAGDPPGEGGADMGRHVGRDIAVHGAAFGGDRAALAHRQVLAELDEPALVGVGQGAFTQPVGGDQGAMDDQVGIAADRRREMRVGVRRESEVADVFGGVHGLFKRAQHQIRQHALFRTSFNRSNELLKFDRLDLSWVEFQSEPRDDFGEVFDFHRIRLFVYAVESRNVGLLQMTGHDFIGEDHEFLNDAMRE